MCQRVSVTRKKMTFFSFRGGGATSFSFKNRAKTLLSPQKCQNKNSGVEQCGWKQNKVEEDEKRNLRLGGESLKLTRIESHSLQKFSTVPF